MKKFLALAVIAPLLISCSSSTKKGDSYNEAWVKDTNGFDILMGQFAHNIENLWGFKEVLIAGPKDYVKYTDQYQTRSHINFDEGTITVEQAAVTVGGQRVITTPKSAAGRRTIYLPTHLTEDARHHLAAFTATDAEALVFPGNDDQPLTPGQVYGHAPRFDKKTRKQTHPGNGFYKARHQIGRPDFRFHDLRHFAATMAAISGATTKELMQFAGHSDIHVAMRYQEAVSERKKDLARRMTELARNNWSDDVSQNAARSRARRDRRD